MEELIKTIQNNIKNNIDKQKEINELLNFLPKGHVNVLYRNNKGYYYLTYREGKNIKNKYLGPKEKYDLNNIMEKLKERKKYIKEIKQLKEEETKLKNILNKI